MNSETNEQTKIRAYLLGQMADADLPDFEQRLLLDAAFYEEVSIVEDELVDEYLRAELSPPDRQSFESQFMSAPERHEKLRFAQAFRKRVAAEQSTQSREVSVGERPGEPAAEVAEPPPKKRPFFWFLPFESPIVTYALAAVILLVIGGVSWVVWKNWTATTPGKVLAIELAPSSMTRDLGGDTEIKKFAIPVDTDTVRLQLDLPKDEYPSYEVILQDANLRPLLTSKNLKAQTANGRPAVFVEVPQESLPPGDYRVKLNGVNANGSAENIAGYSFRILAQ